MKTEKNILIAFILNLSFSIIEFIAGTMINSFAIVSDAFHDMSDAIGIGLSYILEKISKKKPDDKHTYGYARYSVLGSLITTFILISGSILIIYNAIKRISTPEEINYNGMIIIAILGVIINFFAAYFTRGGKSLNQRSVNLHMLEDVLGWVVVLIGAIVMKFTDIKLIDSILSIIVASFIMISSLKNLIRIIDLFLEKTPDNIDLKEIKEHLLNIPGVEDIHHVHVRSIDGFNNQATMHVVINGDMPILKSEIKKELRKHNISHSTIELEDINEDCHDEKCKVKKNTSQKHHH